MKMRIGVHFTEEGRRDLHSLGRSVVVGAAVVALGSVVASLLVNRRQRNE
jgi:hypothetical protein